MKDKLIRKYKWAKIRWELRRTSGRDEAKIIFASTLWLMMIAMLVIHNLGY